MRSPINQNYIYLKNFEGPLELLDELIGTSKINITEIELAQVTEQYLAYIKAMQEFDIDLASEFFVVAATLIYSKTKKLMPVLNENLEEEIDEYELLNRLREYRFYRLLAKKMEEYLDKGSMYFTRGYFFPILGETEKKEISELMLGDLLVIIAKYRGAFVKKAIPVKRRQVTVEQKVQKILLMLSHAKNLKFSLMVLDEEDKPNKIAAFLGVADLVYRQKISVFQKENFNDFSIIKK
ncbi:condensin subunit ScpA [Brevinema andersonii]|uniref:Segregation and condensation protein A n=1 Tax=Brevinema andersonii TaxID=34097 RepID=A0A1I1F107_BREAD|nr:segregation/condensation protein A [Brevinema andersonii]SFB93075.1 condensin subunit ScpA [Brevinema andersonii]